MKRLLPFLIIFILVILFFYPLFSLFFSQDDFFHLRVSQTDGTLAGFLSLFSFRSTIFFYRPIFREAFYNLFFGLFNFNELPYRLVQFLTLFVNIFLAYLVVNRLTRNKLVAWVSAGVTGLSSANLATLASLSGGIQTSGMTMFFLSAIYFYVKFLDSDKTKNRIISLVFFLLALASHELALALPPILLVLTLFKGKKISALWPYFLLSAILVFSEIFIKGLPVGEKQYSFNFSPIKLFNAYEWYFVWGLGLPEMLLDFIGPGIHLNPNLMKYWGDFYRPIFPLFFLIIALMLVALKKMVKEKMFWFFLLWFFIGISPVVLLPLHRATYYLPSVLPAIGGILGYVFYFLFIRKKAFGIAFLIALFILSAISINLSWQTYWAVSRGKAAEKLLSDIKVKFPSLPQGANVYLTNDPNYPFISKDWGGSSKQASVILSGSDALQVIYRDPTIKVYYEDTGKPISDKNLFTITAIVNGK